MTDQEINPLMREVALDIPAPRLTDDEAGLVLKWRRRGDYFEGLVTHEVDGKIITEWLPALGLKPRLEDAQ